MADQDNKFSDKKVVSIINNNYKEGGIGEVDHVIDTLNPNIIHLRAWPNITPEMINDYDGKFWDETWKNKASSCEIEYDSYFSGRFMKQLDRDDSSGITHFAENMSGLMRTHHNAATKYNKEVVEPLINERKSLIDSLIE